MRVVIAAVVASLGFVSSGLAQNAWIADPRTGCKIVSDASQSHQSMTWSGGCQGGLVHGRGVLVITDQGKPVSRYEGDYQNGKRQGRGVMTWTVGGRYDGEFRDNLRSGQGTYTQPDGTRFTGQWRDGKRNGRGATHFANGDRYEGEYADDRRHGTGTMSFAGGDGGSYQGAFREGKPNGFGTYTNRAGHVSSGQWTDGCFRQGNVTSTVATTRKACGFE